MSSLFIGEIRLFPYNFAPIGWLDCDGALLSISDYQTLYTLLGTTWGGDGVHTFALPDLRGRVPLHNGSDATGVSPRTLGEIGGTESVTLTQAQLPAHSHTFQASTAAATDKSPSATNIPGVVSGDLLYTQVLNGLTPTALNSSSLSISGQSLPHNNVMPTLATRFCICFEGVYPSRP
ncbi:microcystin-dependent protein [Luteibacter sp. Sphag1AF]|uniref:phage tail protein n=1 Tax=Luteibacter sp. Sphag1AF TaxID=2587031 RepID=UPI0016102B47|nr:tail fiber protein [Luteibacter sp. Sphag1AF]MBB3226603.1 microcystin-dependent protein [Luteibacter sp. Sphag1AF]